MHNLRIHTDRVSAGKPGGSGVFYSQRVGGPHYLWRLDESGPGRWHFTRLRPSQWHPKVLSLLNEKDVPAALQARIAEHYVW